MTATDTQALGEGIRHRFPVFEHRTYLNSCSQGALSDAVRRAYARLLHAGPDSVAVTTSASAGVASVASALEFGERDTVVTTDLEFPTIGQIWHAQQRRGARVVHVPAASDNTVPLERLAAAIDERTAIVS